MHSSPSLRSQSLEPVHTDATGRVDGKTSTVTGGAHGIGKSAAQHLAEEGATVPITDVDDESGFMTGSGPVVDDGYTVQ